MERIQQNMSGGDASIHTSGSVFMQRFRLFWDSDIHYTVCGLRLDYFGE